MARVKINTLPHREAMGGLAKGLSVIRAFSSDHAALTLSDIARSAGIPAATARRCLLTLEELGYVTRSGRSFLLRPKVLELGAAYLESMNIEHVTRTHLEELARKTSDSAALCVLDGAEIVYIARASVRTLVRLEAHVGSRFPAHATSMGRVLLAGVSPDRLRLYFETASFQALTERTVTNPARLRQLIDGTRRSGYAVIVDEAHSSLVYPPIWMEHILRCQLSEHNVQLRKSEDEAGLLVYDSDLCRVANLVRQLSG